MMTLREYKDIIVNNGSDRVFLEAEQSRLYCDLRELRNTLESCNATSRFLTTMMGKKWVETHENPQPIDKLKSRISYYEACLDFVEEKLKTFGK